MGGPLSSVTAEALPLLSYVLCSSLVLIYLHRLPMRGGRGPVVGTTLVYVVAFCSVHLLLRGPAMLQVVVLLLLTLAYIHATRRVGRRSAAVLACVFVVALDLGDVLVLALLGLGSRHMADLGVGGFAAMRAATLAVDACSVWALSRRVVLFADARRIRDSVLLILPVVTFILFRTAFSSVLQPGADATAAELGMTVLLAISTLVSLIGCTYYLDAEQRRATNDQLELLLRHQRNAYELRLANDEAIRRMRHDILNQLALAQATPGEEARLAHLEAIRERIAAPSTLVRTNNAALDVVLGQKMVEAQGRGVSIDAFVNLEDADFIDPVDVCAMFANALDNAVEACAALPGEADRTVVMRAGTVQGHLVAKVSNPYAGECRVEAGRFLSTKHDAGLHGVGLSSIEAAAGRYDGHVETNAADGVFTLTVVIPLP